MTQPIDRKLDIIILVSPHFNVSATTSFVDPFRVANYLIGSSIFSWTYVSETGGPVESSSGLVVETAPLADVVALTPWLVVVSTSWTPERHGTTQFKMALQKWAAGGVIVGGLDTGAIVLASAGLLRGKTATVHYEHIDALSEIAHDTIVSENMIVFDGKFFTCCGGSAATDLGLRFVHSVAGESIANASARYLFHHDVRGEDQSQNPKGAEPLGYVTSGVVREAIDMMEAHLETTLSIPEISARLDVSQRHLNRLFRQYVRKSPVEYYRDIRLDRARGLVTQTELKFSEIAQASGFGGQVHFSRAYRKRFGLAPSADRIEGRTPFEFRAWPMFKPDIKSEGVE
ncbi:HTH-type transcriptional regulator CdhR [Falsiruegeria litorea R37]|uniref:HTH-type transcriptional regulator CdhR n=1 Tax=Falsiruegeria litorea R37 TaxID=1200284 RepID=A0A1Y5SV33_9RHOB|nr:GlxA family transcriptional regulator [Falsiruegeria litorea]SLN48517.1 HTH-type transcriptional regulator CdhR [Falsiruegeria litorea R37]